MSPRRCSGTANAAASAAAAAPTAMEAGRTALSSLPSGPAVLSTADHRRHCCCCCRCCASHRQRLLRVHSLVIWAVHHFQAVVVFEHLHTGTAKRGRCKGRPVCGCAAAPVAAAPSRKVCRAVHVVLCAVCVAHMHQQSRPRCSPPPPFPALLHAGPAFLFIMPTGTTQCRLRTSMSLQMDSMNRYCHLPADRGVDAETNQGSVASGGPSQKQVRGR